MIILLYELHCFIYIARFGLTIISNYLKAAMESTYRYWCFSCQKHFQAQIAVSSCSLCHSQAIEQAEANNDPSRFAAYQIKKQQTQSQPQPQPQLQHLHIHNFSQMPPPFFNPFFPPFQPFNNQTGLQPPQANLIHMSVNLNNVFQTFQQIAGRQNGIFNLLNSLMGQRNLTAATQHEINRLQKIDKVLDCSICQEEQSEQQRKGYRLQCGHNFHIECLNPWLQRTNTCPTCRSHI